MVVTALCECVNANKANLDKDAPENLDGNQVLTRIPECTLWVMEHHRRVYLYRECTRTRTRTDPTTTLAAGYREPRHHHLLFLCLFLCFFLLVLLVLLLLVLVLLLFLLLLLLLYPLLLRLAITLPDLCRSHPPPLPRCRLRPGARGRPRTLRLWVGREGC